MYRKFSLFAFSAGGLIGVVEAIAAQDPARSFWLNSDRSLYVFAFAAYGLIAAALFLLFPSIKRTLLTRAVNTIGITVFLFAFLYALVPPYRFLKQTGNGSSPNILLITLDTLRADHLGCYGYSKETSPFLDSLAKRGVLFEQAYTNATWTLPSHASLFTGLMPSVHGAGYRNFFVSPTLNTMAERLKMLRYTSAAFTGGPFLASAFNINQGFDYYDEHLDSNGKLKRLIIFRLISKLTKTPLWKTDGQRRSDEINKSVFSYLDWAGKRQPFFLFINYFDAHEPYDPPQKIRDSMNIRTKMKGNIRLYPLNKQNGLACHADGKPLSENEFTELKNLYDGEIRFQDDQLALLWKKLEKLELLSNTLVIITSDHGETIGEHGFLDHGHNLYQEQVRIPLIIVDPKQWSGGKRVSTQVQLIDIAPTILEYLKMAPDKTMQGKSLISVLNGVEDRAILAEIDIDSHPRFAAFRRNQKMLLRNADKYIESSDSKHLLFDLSSSEGEKRNLISERTELGQSMSMELRTIFGALEKLQHQGEGEIDEETREKLKALGYIE